MDSAIILAGGFGTRLRHIVSDVPKPMAPVRGKPFLEYIFRQLLAAGMKKAILAVGYKKECIEEYFGTGYFGMELVYSQEDTPLYTGGAIKKALQKTQAENVLVINGDTFFDIDFHGMAETHTKKNADLTVAVKQLNNIERYGTIEFDKEGRILQFAEKQQKEQGYINGGIYLLRRELVAQMNEGAFSFEQDVMERQVQEKRFYCFESDGYFIDIGVPQDYEKAQVELDDEKSFIFRP